MTDLWADPDFVRDEIKDNSLTERWYRKPGCPLCDTDPDMEKLMPPHSASLRCESGKRDHCSCDTCF